MTMKERSVWAQLFVFPIVGIVYFAVVLTRASTTPVDEVSWVVPLVVAMGTIVVGIIVTTIAMAIATGVQAGARGEQVEFEDGDIRDKEIERHGEARAASVASLGGLAAIILAMLRADPFWIANAVFLFGIAGGFYAGIVKIRAYREGM